MPWYVVSTSGLTLPFHAAIGSTVTPTDQAVAEQFIANSNRNITRADLTPFTQVKLVARVQVGSASANSPRLRLRYNEVFSTVIGDYEDIGVSEVATSLTTAGVIDSGWINLAAGAKADAVFITVGQLGGDAAADPAVGIIYASFK